MEAEVTLEYDDAKIAGAIVKAVSPDNFKTPKNMSITTISEANKVITRIKLDGRLLTFIATIDDLLSCVSTAERALQIAKKLE